MDSLGSGSLREQAEREQQLYESRLSELSLERDKIAMEAEASQARFTTAMREISSLQSELLASEDRRAELETGIDVIQRTLRKAMEERDTARNRAEDLVAQLEAATGAAQSGANEVEDLIGTVDALTDALKLTSAERDDSEAGVEALETALEDMTLTARLTEERNDRIFRQLEDAMSVSLEPLDKMFRAAGLPTESILKTVRTGYEPPVQKLSTTFSTKSMPPSAESLRADGIMERLDQINLYRIAAEKAPFAEPVHSSFRFTSPFGYRNDPKNGSRKMHAGTDFAAAYGTPIYSTADGVVVHAGWQSGYGRLVKIKHEFGIETRYAHLSKIGVKVGQKVSRGDKIGDMGNSGRVTGTHLHYEVRVGDNAVNPMTYIKAARDVF